MTNEGLKKVLEKAGGQKKLGGIVGESQQTVQYWAKTGKAIPIEFVYLLEQELGLSRHIIRPDVFVESEADIKKLVRKQKRLIKQRKMEQEQKNKKQKV